MDTFHIAIDIDRPPADVFAVVADPRTMPLWYDAVDHVAQATDDPTSPGTRYDVVRTLPGGRVHNDVELTEHQPDRLVTFESRTGPTPFRYRYTLEPTGQGTRLRLDGRISGAGLPGPIGRFDGIATRLFARGMRHNLNQLKQLVEASR